MAVIQKVCAVHSMTGVMLSVFLTWLVAVNGKEIELNTQRAIAIITESVDSISRDGQDTHTAICNTLQKARLLFLDYLFMILD